MIQFSSPLQIGLSGMSRGLENIQEIASDVAQSGVIEPQGAENTTNLTQSMVDLEQQKLATQAAAKVVASAEELLGTLVDIKV